MGDEPAGKKGGIHFGRVGGNVNLSAGGDIVGGDKTTTIQKGFRAEEQKQQFQLQVEQLRDELRMIREKIRTSSSLDEDQKEEVEGEILQHFKALKEVKDQTADLPAGQPAPPEMVAVVQSTLERAGGVIDGLERVAKKSVGIAEAVGEFAVKFGPLIASARHLFGLP